MIVEKNEDGDGDSDGTGPRDDRRGVVVGRKALPRIPPPKIRPPAKRTAPAKETPPVDE